MKNPRKTKIIAEACANHMGDAGLQEEMIQAAAEAGADYIKFQSWQAQTNTRGQTKEMAPFELSNDDHFRLQDAARRANIGFSTTIFNKERVGFVAKLNLDFIKIASPDCGSDGLLDLVSSIFPRVILSTGMSDETEIEGAARRLTAGGATFALLHCIYPLVDGAHNLARIEQLRKFAPEVGLSDHSAGDDLRASLFAIGIGADWVERHFTLSRSIKTKDGPVSVDPNRLRELVQAAENPMAVSREIMNDSDLIGDAGLPLSEKVAELSKFYRGRWGDNS